MLLDNTTKPTSSLIKTPVFCVGRKFCLAEVKNITIAVLALAVVLAEWICSSSGSWGLVYNWCGAAEGQRAGPAAWQLCLSGGLYSHLFPCPRHEKGHGAESGGSRCSWAGRNVVRTRTRCLQEQFRKVLHPTRGKWRVNVSEGGLKHVPGQSCRLPCWEAAL